MHTAITFATYNIRHGKGNDGRVSLARIADTLRQTNARVIGLQEVDYLLPRSNFQRQAKQLGERLNKEYAFEPTLRFNCLSCFGNAVLSEYPIQETGNQLLLRKLEKRGLQYCRLDLAELGIVHFFNTHLGLSAVERSAQIRTIVETFAAINGPIVFVGDFNAPPHAPEFKPLLPHLRYAGEEPLPTFPSHEPRHPVDHVYISHHWRTTRIQTCQSTASDHLPLVCALESKHAQLAVGPSSE